MRGREAEGPQGGRQLRVPLPRHLLQAVDKPTQLPRCVLSKGGVEPGGASEEDTLMQVPLQERVGDVHGEVLHVVARTNVEEGVEGGRLGGGGVLHPKDPLALDKVGVGREGDINEGVITNECLALQEDCRDPLVRIRAGDGLLEGGESEDGGGGGGAKDGKAKEVKEDGGKERRSKCACEGGGKGMSRKLRGAAAAAAAIAPAASAAAAPAAKPAAAAAAAEPTAAVAATAAPAADPADAAAAAAAAPAAEPSTAAAEDPAAAAAGPAVAEKGESERRERGERGSGLGGGGGCGGVIDVSRGGRREWSGNGGEERSGREERWEDSVGPGEGARGRRERVKRRSGVVRGGLVEDDITAVDEAVGGRVEEQVAWGVAIVSEVDALKGTGGELASGTGAIDRWDEDEGLAAPMVKAGSVRLGLRPEFYGGGGGMMRVGAEIEEEGGMEEGIAPEGGRGGSVRNKATSNLGDLTNATLSDAVLLRGVGEGGGLLNAVCFAVSGKGMIDELTPTVRVKAADGAFEVSATLLSPVDDHSRHLVFRVKKDDGGVPTVVVDEDEHVLMPLTGADGIRALEIHVNKGNGGGSEGGMTVMGGLFELAMNARWAWRSRGGGEGR
ncbi:unnamed protein product [Closterium sp. NIES-54]